MEVNVWVMCQNLLPRVVVLMDMKEILVKTEVRFNIIQTCLSFEFYFNFNLWLILLFVVYPCDSSPCENNGTCENVEDNFKCTCTEHYEGDTCESRGWFVNISSFDQS